MKHPYLGVGVLYHHVPQHQLPSAELRDRRQFGPWHAHERHDPEEDARGPARWLLADPQQHLLQESWVHLHPATLGRHRTEEMPVISAEPSSETRRKAHRWPAILVTVL